jgi:hypothetical protein
MSSPEHEDREAAAAVARLADALREDIPVRAEWRDDVLRELESLPAHGRAASPRDRGNWTRRRWTLSPIAAAAAALCFVAIGAGAAAILLDRGEPAIPVSESQGDRAGASGTVAGAQRAGSAAEAAGATTVRFVIVAPNASRVSLVGDFNGWDATAMPMHRVNEGDAWARDVVLESGRHVYAFIVDGAFHVDPSAPRAAEDDFGIPSSALVVRNVRQ